MRWIEPGTGPSGAQCSTLEIGAREIEPNQEMTSVTRSVHAKSTSILPVFLLAGLLVLPGAARAQTPNAYNSIGLEWEAGGDDSTAGRASAYELRYSTAAPALGDTVNWFNNVATPAPAGVPSNSGVTDSTRVTGLTPGATYYFIIRAVDEWQNRSAFSNVASATTLDCDEPTVLPSSFTATADTGLVDLAWSGNDPLATWVQIYRGTGTSTPTPLTTVSATTNTYRDTSVHAGTTYGYRIAYLNACATGPLTTTRTATVPGLPPAPPSATGDVSIHAYPNPSSGSVRFVFRLEGTVARDAKVRLYDMAGHWIATVAEQRMSPGQQTIIWPRTDRNGFRVVPGYYEAIGTVGDVRVRERVVLTP
jgi:hypothetical protein